MRDFNIKVRKALTAKGVTIVGTTIIPSNGFMPFANGETGYKINDNGCMRIRTFAQVLEMAA